ncbi:hypothetical protein BU17DRAFT_72557 [Hysterangium stoloniferum]|nr:hypothetical protein BU17DRAFT_72557 [Hysterangium stoloniferum]
MATFLKPKRNRADKKAENRDIVSLGRNIPLNKTDNNTASGSKDYLTWQYVFNLLIQILNGHAAMEDIASSTLTYLDKIDSEKSRPYLTLCPVQTFRPIHQLESTRLFLTQTLGDPNLEASAS